MDTNTAKRAAGYKAADQIADGMVVGLGTGSTVAFMMERLAERVRKEEISITGIATSIQTELKARTFGFPLTTLFDVPRIDITIDGADQVDPTLQVIKGRGAAHVREKIVADASDHLIIVIDEQKRVDALTGPVPIEVTPFALAHVIRRLEALGGRAIIREGVKKDGPVISDNGNIILDYDCEQIINPQDLEHTINTIPGVVSCGLFTGYADKTTIIIGKEYTCQVLGRSLSYP